MLTKIVSKLAASSVDRHPIKRISRSVLWDFAFRLPLIVYAATIVLIMIGDIAAQSRAAAESTLTLTLALRILSDVANAAFLLTAVIITVRRLQPVCRYTDTVPNLLALFAAFLPFGIMPWGADSDNPALLALSGTLVITGTALAVLVLCHLGKAFSVLPEARALVTTGPYGLVRHPLYVCEEIAAIGLVIMSASPSSLFIYILHLLLQLIRTVYEENILRSTFPEYARYQRRVPRFVPRLSRRLWLPALPMDAETTGAVPVGVGSRRNGP